MSSSSRPAKRPFLSCAECAICFETYDLDTRIPIIGNCGHTICAACRTRLPRKCPICQKKNAFVNEVKNFLVIQMIEEKLNENKRQKTDSGCSLCQTPTDDEDSHVCLECVQKKGFKSFMDLMKEVASYKMCSRCAEAIQKHDGHDTHKLCDAKSGLRSMDMMLKMESSAKAMLPRLDRFQTACEVFNETYKQFQETCMANGRILGSYSDFKTLDKHIGDYVSDFYEAVGTNISTIWKLTNECLDATQSVRTENEKLQGRKFTTAEDSTFRSLLRIIYAVDVEQKPNVSMDEWKKMTVEEKKTKALEMMEEWRKRSEKNGSDGNEDEDVGTPEENGEGAE